VNVWLDGRILELEEARISPLDHGLTVGDGVFETMRIYDGVPFAWTRHYERLCASAAGLAIEVPTATALRAACDELLDATGLAGGAARVRVTVTAGEGPPGSGAAHGAPVTFLVATPFEAPSERVDVVVVPWTRNPDDALAGLKTVSYGGNVRALAYAKQQGAGEALFRSTSGFLCEATGSNLFLVRGGALLTPPAESGCLRGVTRALLLELAGAIGVEARETDVSLEHLMEADEAFLSSTIREVQPIAHVDGVALAPGPGPVSAKLADAFADMVARDLDP
jgi:branched-chain amino acid aminotransferase